mgnify:CR=1 FL=1
MSGALVELVSKGVQDAYIMGEGQSLFNTIYKKHSNFAQTPKLLEIRGQKTFGATSVVKIDPLGDLVNAMWFEGTDIIDSLRGTVFELYIGGKLIDSQTFEYISDIWTIYMADTKSKADTINNQVSNSDTNFCPMHFFFCDNDMFLPLVALQHHAVEVRIVWGPYVTSSTDVSCYANYVYLDTDERVAMVENEQTMLITQVQKNFQTTDSGVTKSFDLKYFNHPLKALFFGFEAKNSDPANDYFTFTNASLYLNGTSKFEKMSPNYFHTVQGYYHTQNGVLNFFNDKGCPFYTRFFMYSFGKNVSTNQPTGSCNFSRLDSSKMAFDSIDIGSSRTADNLQFYAVNYNVLKITNGLGGILFSN